MADALLPMLLEEDAELDLFPAAEEEEEVLDVSTSITR
eukprot:CAMPEP_0201640906 /NCGR_PEP_ID=MMETSP0493-20130528/22937_1 /ASSEMBLY_ACC=CAM_ASM_000838 /TAXON_ID=420259 /ORGANISM="Thalassiosira gravida, Strain GMp14c1" /LENGTH=37 /DNA_ID= /DNA_START= /DNA_END= /DNA_ORIENTATION=